MTSDIQIKVCFNKKTYEFDSGAKAYIFHTGVYNNVHKKYGIKGLLEYVSFVFECYISDDDRTPLGALADHISKNWKAIKAQTPKQALSDFYSC